MSQESILVIPRAMLGTFIQFHGFKPLGDSRPEEWLAAASFKSRQEMETDSAFKQLIPYIVLRYKNEVFRYWRTKRGGESRLHHLYSIGIGGHINPRDENLFTPQEDVLIEAAWRELREEAHVDSSLDLQPVGFINDDRSDVGQVHLGIVYDARLESKSVEIKESALGRGEWKSVSDLYDGVEYETWSSFVIDEYLIKSA